MNNNFQREIVQGSQSLDQAYIRQGLTQRPQTVLRMVIDLSVAKTILAPLEITYPFKSLFVEVASDVLAYVYVRPNTTEEQQGYFKLSQNSAWSVEHSIARSFFHWPAQAGKTMEIILFADSKFESGSQISVTGGGVSIVEGSSLTTTVVTLAASSATLVLAADSTRKICNIQNNTGADIWLGPSTVTNLAANLGLSLSPGSTFEWRNTGSIYAYSVAGGSGLTGLTLLSEF